MIVIRSYFLGLLFFHDILFIAALCLWFLGLKSFLSLLYFVRCLKSSFSAMMLDLEFFVCCCLFVIAFLSKWLHSVSLLKAPTELNIFKEMRLSSFLGGVLTIAVVVFLAQQGIDSLRVKLCSYSVCFVCLLSLAC